MRRTTFRNTPLAMWIMMATLIAVIIAFLTGETMSAVAFVCFLILTAHALTRFRSMNSYYMTRVMVFTILAVLLAFVFSDISDVTHVSLAVSSAAGLFTGWMLCRFHMDL